MIILRISLIVKYSSSGSLTLILTTENAMADGPSTRRGEMKDSASFSETGSDIGDNIPQGKKDDDCEIDNGFVEDRFRVDRKKLEQMLQGIFFMYFVVIIS